MNIGEKRFVTLVVASVMITACDGAAGDGAAPTTPTPPAPPAVATVSVAVGAASMLPGRSTTATVELRSAAGTVLTGRAVSWTTSNAAVASIDAGGTITAVATGTSIITATSEGRSGTAAITVLPAAVASVVVTLAAPTVVAGTSTVATALVRDDRGNTLTGRAITWTSSVPSAASVDANGVITTVTPGTTSIVATVEGQSGAALLTITPPPVATVSLTLAQTTLAPGAITTSAVTLRDGNGALIGGRVITYTTSASSVATVSGTGVVSAVAPGTATITASSEGKSASATLTVRYNIATVTFTGSSRVKVGDTYTYAAVARLADGTIVNRPVTWSVKEPGRGIITSSGVLTPLQVGTLTLQATIDGDLWESLYSAYDWLSFSSGGSLFTSLEADNQIIGRRNIPEYPRLTFSCSATGTFFTWVSFTNLITSSGAVAMSFDDAPAFASAWDELSPDFSTLWKPGSNAVVKAFAQQVAGTRIFGFAFTEYLGSAKAMLFRVTGLASRLAPIIAACPGNAIVAGTADAAGVAAMVSPSRAVESAVRLERALRAVSLPTAEVGPTVSALMAVRAVEVQAAVRKR